MSKHDKVTKLKEYIKNFVIKELEKDEELDYYNNLRISKRKKDLKKITRAFITKPVNGNWYKTMIQQESLDELFGFAEISDI